MEDVEQTYINKKTFLQIFRDHWEVYKRVCNPREIEIEVVERMFKYGDISEGYFLYCCENCGEAKKVGFSCKTRLCLSCGQVAVEEWANRIKTRMFKGVLHRHVVLTTPSELWGYFYKTRQLFKVLSDAGAKLMADIIRFYREKGIEVGIILIIQTAGRASNFNPHLHLLVTEGGLDRENLWHDFRHIENGLLGKKWQYFLLTELKRNLPSTRKVKELIDYLFKEKELFITHSKQERIRKTDVVRYLVKYVVSPPIALKRIIKYDGKQVTYYYQSHKTERKEIITVSALDFIHRMVQHIPEKNFNMIREYELYARRRYKIVAKIIAVFMRAFRRVRESSVDIISHLNFGLSWRERIKKSFNKDPCRCPRCGQEMLLWEIWVKDYGTIYSMRDELEDVEDRDEEVVKEDIQEKTYSQLRLFPVPV